jgi:LmbE family N-acetylglucosaminyl deacetylase
VLRPLVVVSPHFDDAGLSCVSLFAQNPGAVLLTVFGNGPEVVDPIPSWDAASGFVAGDDVIGVRASEDKDACDVMGAVQMRLEHWDSQYRSSRYRYSGPTKARDLVDAIANSIDDAFNGSGPAHGVMSWALPLAAGHSDHELATMATLQWARRRSGVELMVYDDLPYSVESTRHKKRALRRIRDLRYSLEPLSLDLSTEADKVRVVECYVSQLGPLADRVQLALASPEIFYRLIPV